MWKTREEKKTFPSEVCDFGQWTCHKAAQICRWAANYFTKLTVARRGETNFLLFTRRSVVVCHKVSRYSLASSGRTLSDRSGPEHFNVNISHSWQPSPRLFIAELTFLFQIKIRASRSLFIRERPMAEIDKFKWTQSRYRENKSGSGSTRVGVMYWHILPLGISDPNIIIQIDAGAENKVKHINIY